ncbi:transposase [Paeniroseomonas aquatica]|uniref:transposase n=1 Tax=Paeniroseomonas aquatica TaxID=373043 RepID=UPI003608BF67
MPGGSPIAVARRHGIGTGLLYTWRRQMVEGQLKALMPAAPSFMPVAAVPENQTAVAAPISPRAAPLLRRSTAIQDGSRSCWRTA